MNSEASSSTVVSAYRFSWFALMATLYTKKPESFAERHKVFEVAYMWIKNYARLSD